MSSKILLANALAGLDTGKHHDGDGLWFRVRPNGSRAWFIRYHSPTSGKRRDMGLGAYPAISLKQARAKNDELRDLIAQGIDPMDHKSTQKAEAERQEAMKAKYSFRALALEAFEARKPTLKGKAATGGWLGPLKVHAFDKIGDLHASEIDQSVVVDVLKPIWHTKAATADRVAMRIHLTIEHAAAHGIDVDLLAVKKAKLLLGEKDHKAEPRASMPWENVPGFYESLDETVTSHRGLKLLILTGHRVTAVCHMQFDQIDTERRIWTVPGEQLKGRKNKTPDHRVYLSDEAMRLIKLCRQFSRCNYVLEGGKRGLPLSDNAFGKLLRDRQAGSISNVRYTPHGFRTSLRDWAETQTTASWEAKETLIQHAVTNKVERSYLRTDWLEQRIPIYEQWASFVLGERVADVIKLSR